MTVVKTVCEVMNLLVDIQLLPKKILQFTGNI